MAIDVNVLALLENPVPQFEINGNKLTYFATPYRGNRNDAIQQHPDATNACISPHPQQGLEFIKMIIVKNPSLKPILENKWSYFIGKI